MRLEDLLREKLNKFSATGRGFGIAACPVHKGGKERNPSFSINLRSGKYKCYSCGISGDKTALLGLIGADGAKVGLEVSETVPQGPTNDDVHEAVLGMFKYCPLDLIDAGFTEKTLLDNEVGYDALYERITFPIRSVDGKLVAISGRGDAMAIPRYKVYTTPMLRGAADDNYAPESKNHLYGAHTVTPGEKLVVVEGFKACLWLRQCGFSNTVATMGTQIKAQQMELLRKISGRVIIFFDSDLAGTQSSHKTQAELLKKGVPTVVVDYHYALGIPEGTDLGGMSPDDLSPEQVVMVMARYGLLLESQQ